MKKLNIIGEHAWHEFKSNTDGSIILEMCSLQAYDALALRNAAQPQKAGYTWLTSFKGPKFNSTDGFLEVDSYAVENNENVLFRDEDGLHGKIDKAKFDKKTKDNEKVKRINMFE